MTELKKTELLTLLESMGPCAAAFSGGVDSCVLARAISETARKMGWNALALTARSPSMPEEEAAEIVRIAKEIGIPHRFVFTRELEIPEYRSNIPTRCYFCKKHILERLKTEAEKEGLLLTEGSNADDLNDYRPGFQAVQEWKVASPLCAVGLTKEMVRALARNWGLSTAEKPSTPCLASRIAYGVEITPERLRRVELAEKELKALGASPLRVRLHENELARIEIPQEQMNLFLRQEFRLRVAETLKKLGFSAVTLDLEGFRSGSMNQISGI